MIRISNGGNDESDGEMETIQNHQKAQHPRAVNTESIVIAREMSGFTQSELARRSGLSQAKISRFEDGITQPNQEELNLLAKHLEVPEKLFHRSDLKRSVFNSFYRKRKSVSQRTLMQFNSRVCFRQVQIDRLLSKADLETEPIPRFDPAEFKGGLVQVAAALRQFLKLPPGPVKGLMSALEDVGVIIVMDDFGVTKIDGVSTFSNNGSPIIFLNTHAPNSRRRFSLAHELAHTVLHQYVAPDADEQADALAAEFLMPRDEISSDISSQPLTLARLANLKLKWRVAMAAILYRAKTLGLIGPRRYTYMWTQMSSAGYKIHEPHEELLEDERPTLESELVEFHRDDLGYSTTEIAETLDISPLEVSRRYGLTGDLKVV